LKALARDPDDRYANAIDLHDDLQSFLYSVGEFFSRKDLAAWMKKTFAMEIEEDNAKLEEFRQVAPPVAANAEVSRRAAVAGPPELLLTPKPIELTPEPSEEIKMTPPPMARPLPLPPAARRPTLVGVPHAGVSMPGFPTPSGRAAPSLPPPGPPPGRTGLRR